MLIQIHILQNYAPSNLNRDDTGSPKDAVFGGFRRGRISSQCLKRSIRRSATFEEAFKAKGLLGMRTRTLPARLKEALEALGADAAAIKAILPKLAEIGRESNKNDGNEAAEGGEKVEETTAGMTKQLIFIGENELKPMAEKILAMYREVGEKKWAGQKISEMTKQLGASLPKSVDIAMFGRMTTSEAFEDVHAAAQVAHAISTNALAEEFDYYTAVDDLSGEAGAGMIGDVEFNSSTYYKYLNVHWEKLVENLGGDRDIARQAVLALVEAAALAQPSGKQNTFAAYNLPDLVLVEISRRNLPVSYANAFLQPARANVHSTLIEASFAQLAAHMQKISATFNLKGERALITTLDCDMPGSESVPSLSQLGEWVAQRLQ
jgi:CRISPR system Cascade subunit CasC